MCSTQFDLQIQCHPKVQKDFSVNLADWLKYILSCKETRICKEILKEEKKFKSLTLLDFRINNKATIIKTVQ